MTTSDAITLAQAKIVGAQNNSAEWDSEEQAWQTALAILQNTLDNPSADLVAAQAALVTEQTAHENDNSTNETVITTQAQYITDLQNQVTGLGATPVTS